VATYLKLVQKAVRKSGASVDVPTTIVGATGITEMFVEWVQDAWKDIQLEHMGWNWRVVRDDTLAITAGTDEYAMPADLESFDNRTLSIYIDPADESPLHFVNYHVWRNTMDKQSPATPARPQRFTITPDDKIAIFPPPDVGYTLRMDGFRVLQLLDVENNNDIPAYLRPEYHDGIMWRAVMYYAQHFEDGAKLQEAQAHFKPYKKYYEERELEDITLDTTSMYSRGH